MRQSPIYENNLIFWRIEESSKSRYWSSDIICLNLCVEKMSTLWRWLRSASEMTPHQKSLAGFVMFMHLYLGLLFTEALNEGDCSSLFFKIFWPESHILIIVLFEFRLMEFAVKFFSFVSLSSIVVSSVWIHFRLRKITGNRQRTSKVEYIMIDQLKRGAVQTWFLSSRSN